MRNIIIFDTSVGSMNKGDEIIMKSCQEHLEQMFAYDYVAKFPTHTPSFTMLQQVLNPRASFVSRATFKIVCGTNLLYTNMIRRLKLWNIGYFNYLPNRNSLLMGVGSWGNNKIGFLSKFLYRKILSNEHIHSTRDEKTKLLLNQIGIKAVNTGCPTLWNLNPEFCSKIPTMKSDDVIITLNGTHPSLMNDQKVINTLNGVYKNKYIWIQSPFDLEYFRKFENIDEFVIIPPSIEEFSKFLNEHEVDYVGTRLHAGIFAMQHKKRALIVAIDSRAEEIHKSNNLNCITYDKIDKLTDILKNKIITDVKLNYSAIETWKSQFQPEYRK